MGLARYFHEPPETDHASRSLWPGTVNVIRNSRRAAAAYRDGFDLMLAAWSGAEKAFDAAVEADPEFALAHAARARMHYIYADGRAARAKAAVARELVVRNGTARERRHVDVLALGMEGQPVKSLERALAHLDSWPRNAVHRAIP
jgi:hypothetical protein